MGAKMKLESHQSISLEVYLEVEAEGTISTTWKERVSWELLMFRNYCLEIFCEWAQIYFLHMWIITRTAGTLGTEKQKNEACTTKQTA